MPTKPKKAFEHDHRLKLLNSIMPGWEMEVKFHETRRWRFDYAHKELKVAVEINGGCFVNGRHSRGIGQIKDFEKLNAAQIAGWRVLQYTPQQTAELMRDFEQIKKEDTK